jgi:hypothetical protein
LNTHEGVLLQGTQQTRGQSGSFDEHPHIEKIKVVVKITSEFFLSFVIQMRCGTCHLVHKMTSSTYNEMKEQLSISLTMI